MDEPRCHLEQIHRDGVLEAIQDVSAHSGWSLLAAHLRSNHVHTVVADVPSSEF
jgi:REP element-mobilizing transposase RayT